jgi:hypothetical protein
VRYDGQPRPYTKTAGKHDAKVWLFFGGFKSCFSLRLFSVAGSESGETWKASASANNGSEENSESRLESGSIKTTHFLFGI